MTNDTRVYFRGRYDALRLYLTRLHHLVRDDPALIRLAILLALAIGLALLSAPRLVNLLREVQSKLRVRSGRASVRDVTVAYEHFLMVMAKRGVKRTPSTTPQELAEQSADPGVREFTVVFEEARYGGATDRLPELYRLLGMVESKKD